MKNPFFLLIFTGLILNISISQEWQIDWQQCYGGSDNDYATDIVMIEGGYFVVGATSSTDGDVGNNDGGGEGWLIRIDSISNLIWEKTYGGTDGERFVRIHESFAGDYYLIGSSSSSDGDVSYNPYPNSINFWIIKIDSSGSIIWDRVVGGNGGDHIFNAIHTADDGIIALGYTNSDDGDISTHYGSYDIWMIKLNNEGETEWDFTIGNSAMDFPGAIIETTDGGFLVGGSSEILGGGNLNCETNGLADAVIIKLDSLRNIEWQQCYGGSEYDGALVLLELEDGYMFSGYAGSNDGDILGWHGGDDIWLVRLDISGNIIWQKCLGGGNNEGPSNLFQDDDGGFTVIGATQSNNGDVSGNHSLLPLDHDIWIVKVTEAGEIVWQQCFGGEENEILHNGVFKKGEYNYVIAGETNDESGDVMCNLHSWKNDFWVFEVTIEDTTTIMNYIEDAEFKVYPNPANDYVLFEIDQRIVNQQIRNHKQKINVFNVFGKKVINLFIESESTVWDTKEIKPGIYFYSTLINGKILNGKIIKQ